MDRCHNKNRNAAKLESTVWAEIERILSHPEIIITELEKQRHAANQMGVLETELNQAERQLKAVDTEQHQLLQWALKGFPESQIESENKRINKARETFQGRKVELETQIKASQDAIISVPKLEHTVELLRQQLKDPDYATKRDFIESMGITVWLDGDDVEITGFLPTEEVAIAHTSILIELLIVIAILGILAAVIIPNVTGFITSGKIAAANSEVAAIQTAQQAYEAENNGSYSTGLTGLAPYLSNTPKAVYTFDATTGLVLTADATGSGSYGKVMDFNLTTQQWQRGTTGKQIAGP